MTQDALDFQQFFYKMPIPRFILRVSGAETFSFVAANELALKYLDLPATEVLHKTIQAVFSQEAALHFQQSFEVCVSKKRSVTIQSLPGVPGKIKVYGFYITPVLGADEELAYLDVIGQLDVVDQSILQRERDDAVSLMTSIFDVSEVGIVVTDYNAQIVRVNDSFVRTYGWSRGELIRKNFSDLVTSDEREMLRKNHEEFIRSGIRSAGEIKIMHKEGGVANTLYTTATLEFSQKQRFQIITVMDITLRKQMEQSLRVAKDDADAANRAKSVFLANMSHELRTPLNAIIGFSEMMIHETFGPLGHEKYREYNKDVYSSAHHLLEIINEVLDMSKIEAGRIDLDEVEMDVSALMRSVVRMVDSRAFGQNIQLRLDLEPALPILFGDQRLVRQIFINLVTNAVKFSKPDGKVYISVRMLEDGRMQMIVRDEGIGIPLDKLDRVMEPFGQVSDRPESAHVQGTGLGLPLAKAMAGLHSATFHLESEVGRGTSVFVEFPAFRIVKT